MGPFLLMGIWKLASKFLQKYLLSMCKIHMYQKPQGPMCQRSPLLSVSVWAGSIQIASKIWASADWPKKQGKPDP